MFVPVIIMNKSKFSCCYIAAHSTHKVMTWLACSIFLWDGIMSEALANTLQNGKIPLQRALGKEAQPSFHCMHSL